MIFLYYSGKQGNMPPAKTGGFIFAHSLRRVRVFSPKCPVRLLSCFFSGSFKNILFYFTKNPRNYKNGELILIFSQNKFTAYPIWKSVYSYDYLSPRSSFVIEERPASFPAFSNASVLYVPTNTFALSLNCLT